LCLNLFLTCFESQNFGTELFISVLIHEHSLS
jgi:hypothetical protein